MKMTYLRDNAYVGRRAGRGWKKPVLFGVTIISLYLWGSGAFADLFSLISYPFARYVGGTNENFTAALRTRKQLLEDNTRLLRENTSLKIDAKELQTLRSENEQLRGFKSGTIDNRPGTYATVIAKPPHLPYDELVIDAGTDNDPGLRPGLLVFADSRVVLGQVEQVGKKFSKVKLYSEGGVSLPVSVGDEEHPSVALGQGGGNFKLTLPRGVTVKVGDAVNTTIIGKHVLGYVGSVTKAENDPFQQIIFRSPYNYFTLNWVFVSHE